MKEIYLIQHEYRFSNQEMASRPTHFHPHFRRGEVRHRLHIRVLALVAVATAIVVLGPWPA